MSESPPEIHDHLRTVIVAPMTPGNRPAGFRVRISFQGVNGLILLEQSCALDKRRLVKHLGRFRDLPRRHGRFEIDESMPIRLAIDASDRISGPIVH